MSYMLLYSCDCDEYAYFCLSSSPPPQEGRSDLFVINKLCLCDYSSVKRFVLNQQTLC